MKKNRLSLEQKRSRFGYVFLIPWLIGIVFFFLLPVITTVRYSLGNVSLETMKVEFIGMKNFVDAFRTDAEFPMMLSTELLNCLKRIPFIVFFSFFIALVLRKNFRGSIVVKSIFFLTVFMSSDVFLMFMNQNASINGIIMDNVAADSENVFAAMNEFSIEQYLIGFGLPQSVIDFIDSIIADIANIIIHSGIQIFIFLAALHSIPDSMYEAANIEGATAWENIWKITFPLMTPFIVVNLVYTVVDSFITMYNPLLQYIYDAAYQGMNFGYSAALSMIFFAIIGSILVIIMLFMRKRTIYQG